MKNIQIMFLLLMLLSSLGATKYAGEIFSFSPGVANQAMGSTGLSYTVSPAAGWWNPALLTQDSRAGIELMRSEHFEGLLSQNQLSISFGNASSFNINHLAIDKIKLTRLENEDEELSNDNRPYVWKTVTNQDIIISGSFARALTERIFVGISPKFAYRDLAEHSGYGFGADLGAFWTSGKQLSVGINLRDFFGTQILWESGEHEIALPNLDLEASYGFDFLKYDIPVLIALRAQAFPEERGDASNLSSSGLSADLHAGLLLQIIPQLSLMTGYDVDSFTAGLGLDIKALGINYAFKAKAYDSLGYTQKISLSYSW
ncbi:MAG: hypothetical protein RBR69_02435 [Candidatus Cloacimonadaceae bacterium]|jgi:hypothetical protein|nr:hypothetical protein [Candidatus Cloacimonadota bacterium]MDY0126975.1 hypothetical protein [Candidatus Cloacimonadaceae bacterium]MCB5255509.1 hypothetical protein [Candidatus Cloacimonadota bacterium]MCK9179162.1 hypothetical protein [Candidatus Cloacimonadota bacterium]MCK9243506.1 hypothetical protein [Candidatus Cloacimonadota bacterium]